MNPLELMCLLVKKIYKKNLYKWQQHNEMNTVFTMDIFGVFGSVRGFLLAVWIIAGSKNKCDRSVLNARSQKKLIVA